MGYFKPLRRKFGAAIMLVVLLLVNASVNSYLSRASFDFVAIPDIPTRLTSVNGRVAWEQIDAGGNSVIFNRDGFSVASGIPPKITDSVNVDRESFYWSNTRRSGGLISNKRSHLFGVQLVEFNFKGGVVVHGKVLIVPYWQIVLPLVMLAAWLLLSKPWQDPTDVSMDIPLNDTVEVSS